MHYIKKLHKIKENVATRLWGRHSHENVTLESAFVAQMAVQTKYFARLSYILMSEFGMHFARE